MTETTNINDSTSQEWYFTENGQRKGPFPAAALLDFLQANRISGDTSVWRKGLQDWQPLKSTELGAPLQEAPPPVAPSNINNALVWIIAIAPIPYAFFSGIIEAFKMDDPLQPHRALDILAFLVPAFINAALCLSDERQLKRAGYSDKWLTTFGFILAPAYLFIRAKRLRHFPSYGITWIATFAVSILLSIPY
ncbi:DUF4339 domain-containing protein [Tardiphaga alba]|uniref:DUF4339 domain-containing protein n=1 Tax=Tardiphaga alba TaxID=340268 RepID=A0ABX8A891_9BRAD|nr:DUF4339 domain-containing protein [Tardiphaga alba]QUS38030.1 DUF4339 domain-containing protein [Tardiphaga alba]